ncbi:hypothetical protein MSAN_01492300 [Mycena sanguinolenta]|uniref:Uncharacterized protein n=1 Tax=Mycena sanguinolenta TaxID=230812 RepID=A0A8H6YCD1_9AGAR|nr:hypothetical protein MSAN_01492300 [Mycena sanguinolenta]
MSHLGPDPSLEFKCPDYSTSIGANTEDRKRRPVEWDQAQKAAEITDAEGDRLGGFEQRAAAARRLAHPHSVVVAEINKDDAPNPFRRLLIIPTSAEYKEIECVPEKHCLHRQAAQDLKVLDVVRLVGMILGVPSLPPSFAPPSNYETKMTWITVHGDADGEVSAQDLTHSLEGVPVKEWEGRVLYLQIHGKKNRLGTSEKDIVEMATKFPPPKWLSSDTLRRAYTKMYNLPANRCFLSGHVDPAGVIMTHVVPFQMGSALVHELMRSVDERSNEVQEVYGDWSVFDADPENPIIGGVHLFSKHSGWVPLADPKGTVNAAFNLRPVDAFLEGVTDSGNGIFISTTPKLWLPRQDNLYSQVFFYGEVKYDLLPIPAPPPVSTVDEISAFLLASFADAARLYLRFGSDDLRKETNSTFQRLKDCLAAMKQEAEQLREQKRKKGDDTDGSEGRKADPSPHPGLDYLNALFTSKAELEHKGKDSKSRLTPQSQDILSTLFGVHKPGPDDEERLGILHEKVQIYFAMLANWKSGLGR